MTDNNLTPGEWVDGADDEWVEGPLTHPDPAFDRRLAEARQRGRPSTPRGHGEVR